VASDFYTDGQMEALGIEPGTLTTPSGRVIDEVRSREDVYVPPRDYITAASDYYTDGQLADMGMEPGTAVSTGANPQQSAGTPLNLTPEQQAALDAFIANNPGGTVIGTPFGNVSLPDLSNYTGGGGSPSTNTRAMDFVIQNLAPVEREAYDPRVATQYAASALPPTPQRGNPFRRPEDQGIASLVPSGG
jgi:hypothetical protein